MGHSQNRTIRRHWVLLSSPPSCPLWVEGRIGNPNQALPNLEAHTPKGGAPTRGVFPKIRGILPPKWMVFFHGKPHENWKIWGENPLFLETPWVKMSSFFARIFLTFKISSLKNLRKCSAYEDHQIDQVVLQDGGTCLCQRQQSRSSPLVAVPVVFL